VARILGGGSLDDARGAFEAWTPTVRRGFVLLIDKIYNAGWLDSVGPLLNVWDTAFHFTPRTTDRGTLVDVIDAKARFDGTYIENSIENGAFAYLTKWNHQDWVRGWMETDVPHATLHVGVRADGNAEVHMELYNPMFIKGAPVLQLVWIPAFGWLNRPLTVSHQRLEAGAAGSNRRSANYYHFMHDSGFPLSF
jgi:hypothetical protein